MLAGGDLNKFNIGACKRTSETFPRGKGLPCLCSVDLHSSVQSQHILVNSRRLGLSVLIISGKN